MKRVRNIILLLKSNIHLIISVMAATGLLSVAVNLATEGLKEDALSITVNTIVALLFSYYMISRGIMHYRKLKSEDIKKAVKQTRQGSK